MHTLTDLQRFLVEHSFPENLIVHPDDFLWVLMRLGAVTYPCDPFGPYIDVGATRVRPGNMAAVQELNIGKPTTEIGRRRSCDISGDPLFADTCEGKEHHGAYQCNHPVHKEVMDERKKEERRKEDGEKILCCGTCFAPMEWVTIVEKTPTFTPHLFSTRMTHIQLCSQQRTHSKPEAWLREYGIAVDMDKERGS